jgi:cytoskeletal protein RodZ
MTGMTREPSLSQQEQVQRLMQIGAYLRQVREDHLLSLEEVAAKTLIQPRLLRAIEAGELHQLPEPVYIQGFIKRYADSLGLDGNDCANAFPTDKLMRVPNQDSWKDTPAAQLRPLHLYVGYIALIAASVSLLSHIVGRSPTAAVTPPRTSNGQVQPSERPAIAAGSPDRVAATTGLGNIGGSRIATRPASDQPVQVQIKLTAQSWIEIEVDGAVKLAEVLPEGTERNWTADKQLRVRAGNAGGVTLAYNGGQAQQMGAPGAVEEKTFSANQNSASLPKPETTQVRQ